MLRRAEESSDAQPAERLQRLVVQLACPPPPFLLGSCEAAAQALALKRLSGGDGDGCAGCSREQQPLVLDAQLGTVDAIEGFDHADVGPAEHER